MKEICWDADRIGPWVCARTGGTWVKGRGTALGKLVDGELVAGTLYEDYSGTNLTCHIAGDDNWADRYFLGVIFQYPFWGLKVNRLTAPVCESNTKSVALLTKMGFNLEAKLHGATSKGDLLLYVMFKDECKYLRGKYGKVIAPPGT